MDEAVAQVMRVVAVGRVVVVHAGPATEHLPPATIGDFAQLLDIDVDQFSGALSLIAADDPPGWAVHPGQTVEAETDQDPVHGRGSHAPAIANAGWAELELCTQVAYLGLEVVGGSMGASSDAACSSGPPGPRPPPRRTVSTTCSQWPVRCPFPAQHGRRADPLRSEDTRSIGQLG